MTLICYRSSELDAAAGIPPPGRRVTLTHPDHRVRLRLRGDRSRSHHPEPTSPPSARSPHRCSCASQRPLLIWVLSLLLISCRHWPRLLLVSRGGRRGRDHRGSRRGRRSPKRPKATPRTAEKRRRRGREAPAPRALGFGDHDAGRDGPRSSFPVIAEGVVRARHTAEIKFELAGRIAQVHVQEGQRVRRGQRLATLDDREYVVASEEARANTLDALGQLAVEEERFRRDRTDDEQQAEFDRERRTRCDGASRRDHPRRAPRPRDGPGHRGGARRGLPPRAARGAQRPGRRAGRAAARRAEPGDARSCAPRSRAWSPG